MIITSQTLELESAHLRACFSQTKCRSLVNLLMISGLTEGDLGCRAETIRDLIEDELTTVYDK